MPRQDKPVVMNVKGASASGKSTMRPLQKVLARKLKFPWEEFALISPDIWRKFLLDYGSLGVAYKYAGTLSGHEVEIIDKKLDRRMTARATPGRCRICSSTASVSIVSFRSGKVKGRAALTRFGDLVYMFFMITPPEMTVGRASTGFLKVGAYRRMITLALILEESLPACLNCYSPGR